MPVDVKQRGRSLPKTACSSGQEIKFEQFRTPSVEQVPKVTIAIEEDGLEEASRRASTRPAGPVRVEDGRSRREEAGRREEGSTHPQSSPGSGRQCSVREAREQQQNKTKKRDDFFAWWQDRHPCPDFTTFSKSVRSSRGSKEFYQRFSLLHQRLWEKAATLDSFRG